MNIEDMLDINDCPLCDGGALLEEECGCGYYVMCMECGRSEEHTSELQSPQ